MTQRRDADVIIVGAGMAGATLGLALASGGVDCLLIDPQPFDAQLAPTFDGRASAISFSSFRQIAYVRVGQFLHTGTWSGRVALRPAVELAFLYGRLTRDTNLADASPERSVVESRVPILLIHGMADDNIPPQQSEQIRDHNPAEIVLWEVPLAGHCNAVNADQQEFDRRVLGWLRSHETGFAAARRE